jgi:hypothetical protein
MTVAMTTAFIEASELHGIHVIHQKGLASIRAVALCTIEGNAGAGIYQVPSWAFDGRATWNTIKVCQRCAQVIQLWKEPPPK